MNAKKTTGKHTTDEDADVYLPEPAITELGEPLVNRDPDDLVGRAFAVCDEAAIAQPMGVIVGRIAEPSCCLFQRIDGSIGMVATSAFTVRAPNVGREPGQVVLYRDVHEMTRLLNPPVPPKTQAEIDAEAAGFSAT
jgi:hypothetical protein